MTEASSSKSYANPSSTPTSSSSSTPPLAYVVEKLNEIAQFFWDKPETSDVTVIVPLPIAPLSHRKPLRIPGSPKQARSTPTPFAKAAGHSELYGRRRQNKSDKETFKTDVDDQMNIDRRESEVSNVSSISSGLPSASTSTSTIFTPASSIPPSSSKDASGPIFSRNVNNPIMMESDLRRGSAPVNNASRAEGSYWQSIPSDGFKVAPQDEEQVEEDEDSLFDRTTRSGAATTMRRLTFKLHQEYLTTQSTLFRKILSSTSPLDLSSDDNLSPTSPNRESNQSRRDSTSTSSSFPNLPEPLLLTPPAHSHPVIFLPLPDPYSFGELIKFLYFGELDQLGLAMRSGAVRWEGIVANTQLLGLNSDVKRWLGVWFKENADRVSEDRKAKEMEKLERMERVERDIESLTTRYDSNLSLKSLLKDSADRDLSSLKSVSSEDNLRRKRMSSSLQSPHSHSSSVNHLPNSQLLQTTSWSSSNLASTSPNGSSTSSAGDGDSDTTMKQPANKVRRNSELQKDISTADHFNHSTRPEQVSFFRSPTLGSKKLRRPTSASSTPRAFNPNLSSVPNSQTNTTSSFPPSSFVMGGFSSPSGAIRKKGRIPRPHSRA